MALVLGECRCSPKFSINLAIMLHPANFTTSPKFSMHFLVLGHFPCIFGG
jgi:hypothetical protein